MSTKDLNPLAGKLVPYELVLNIPKLVSSYYTDKPDPSVSDQKVSFGTSGHRGSSLYSSFNENHVLAITQAICDYRKLNNISGPLFIGFDTHALSISAYMSALEVLAANDVSVMIAEGEGYTPTPAVSHAILVYNKNRTANFADGIVITPSHNPPEDGGFKYNPPNGGPADTGATKWIEAQANDYLVNKLSGIQRIDYKRAKKKSTTRAYDYISSYVSDLENVIDFSVIKDSNIRMAVDPLGGAGVKYWERIAEYYKLNLTVVNKEVDPTFRFMTLDWDGRVRMDPSSACAMQSLIGLKDKFDIAFACDPDHDRHGIVTPTNGLMQPNHYLSVAIYYLFKHRPNWSKSASIGKTLVSSQMIDRVAKLIDRQVYEVPVGFKWFVDGLIDGSLAFVGEESAGATFLRKDGSVWTTDKDGLVPGLLSAEITARLGKDPSEVYKELTDQLGAPIYDRVEAVASKEEKKLLANMSPESVKADTLAGEKIEHILSSAPGNGASIGGLKVMAENGWFAARPSGTEDIYKIYAESFKGEEHLQLIIKEAQEMVKEALGA